MSPVITILPIVQSPPGTIKWKNGVSSINIRKTMMENCGCLGVGMVWKHASEEVGSNVFESYIVL